MENSLLRRKWRRAFKLDPFVYCMINIASSPLYQLHNNPSPLPLFSPLVSMLGFSCNAISFRNMHEITKYMLDFNDRNKDIPQKGKVYFNREYGSMSFPWKPYSPHSPSRFMLCILCSWSRLSLTHRECLMFNKQRSQCARLRGALSVVALDYRPALS